MVSFIITTCKRSPELVTRALRSTMAQTYQDTEIIVVDDSPVDYPERENVRQAVLALCPSVRYFQHDKQRGAPAARNTGIRMAKGEFIAFLDDDDEWIPEKTEKQLAGFIHEGIALVYSGFLIREESLNIQYEWPSKYCSGQVIDQLLETNFIGSTSIPLIRKPCLEAIGGFDEEMKSAQDYDIYLRLARKYEINYIQQSLIIYQVHEGERISNTVHDKVLGGERICQKYAEDLERNPKAWVMRHRSLIPFYRMDGRIGQALLTWMRTARKVPFDWIGNGKYLLLALITQDYPLYQWYHRQKVKKLAKENKK